MPTKNIVVVFKRLMSNQELQNSNYCMCVWNTLHYIYKLGTLVHLIKMYWTEYNLKHLEATVIMIWCCKNNTELTEILWLWSPFEYSELIVIFKKLSWDELSFVKSRLNRPGLVFRFLLSSFAEAVWVSC